MNLSMSQQKLLMTLGCERRLTFGAHPASLVRDLRIYFCFDLFEYGDSQEGQKKKEVWLNNAKLFYVILIALHALLRDDLICGVCG